MGGKPECVSSICGISIEFRTMGGRLECPRSQLWDVYL